jgi:hypothetical protein
VQDARRGHFLFRVVLTITEVLSLNNINRLIVVAETLRVFSEVRIIFFILFRKKYYRNKQTNRVYTMDYFITNVLQHNA